MWGFTLFKTYNRDVKTVKARTRGVAGRLEDNGQIGCFIGRREAQKGVDARMGDASSLNKHSLNILGTDFSSSANRINKFCKSTINGV